MLLETLREQVYEANLELVRRGLVLYTWGNASARDPETGLVVIKPSGVEYGKLRPADMVVVDLEGNHVDGTLRPSSDTPTHLELYRSFAGVGGVVHTHSTWATTLAQAGVCLPCHGTTHADYFYGTIPCTRRLQQAEIEGEYERQTGVVIVECFRAQGIDPLQVPAVLVQGHAPFTWGPTVEDAVHNAVVLEQCALMTLHARALNPQLAPIEQPLLDKHYLRKHGAKAYYGQK